VYNKNKVLKEAIKFHGHLGPYLVLGILAGELALKKLRSKKYFGIDVKVWGANQKPKSCLIDGLQLSTGATYGKGNINKLSGNDIRILFTDRLSNKDLKVCLQKKVVDRLGKLKGHGDSENFAGELFNAKPENIFKLTAHNS
jgi:formylmethanofuran dehydrogenase subunit E